RILRAARFLAFFGWTPAPATLALAQAAVPALCDLPSDRIRDELGRLLTTPRCASGLHFLAETGALAALFPEMAEHAVASHALIAIDATAGLQTGNDHGPDLGMVPLTSMGALREWYMQPLSGGRPRIVALRWGLLLHGLVSHTRRNVADVDMTDSSVGWPPGLVRAAHRLRLPRPERAIVREIGSCVAPVRQGLAEQYIEVQALPQALRHVLPDHFIDWLKQDRLALIHLLVAAAACNAALFHLPLPPVQPADQVAQRVRTLLDPLFTQHKRPIPQPLLDGSALVHDLGMTPGPLIGHLLRRLRAAQLDGVITTREEAVQLAQILIDKRPESPRLQSGEEGHL